MNSLKAQYQEMYTESHFTLTSVPTPIKWKFVCKFRNLNSPTSIWVRQPWAAPSAFVIGIPLILRFIDMPAFTIFPSSSNNNRAGQIFGFTLSANLTMVTIASPALGFFPTAVVSFAPELIHFCLLVLLIKNTPLFSFFWLCSQSKNNVVVCFPRVWSNIFGFLYSRFLEFYGGYLFLHYI